MVETPASFTVLSLQSLAEGLRRLPGLFMADVSVAHSGANILVPKQLLDFPQILSNVIEENRCRAMAQPMGCNHPHP